MRFITVLILLINLTACTEEKTNPIDFDTIDYSYYVGYFASIKILNNGKTSIWLQFNTETDNNYYYSLTLDKSSIDSLSKMSKILFEDKVDSFYIPESVDHPISFNLIINSNTSTLSTKYFGAMECVKQKSLYNMANFLYEKCDKVRDPDDSTFIFKSKSGLFLPRPVPIESK